MKKYLNQFIIILGICCFTSCQIKGQETSLSEHNAIPSIEKEIQQELESGQGPGASISIYHNGQFFNQGYGFANAETQNEVQSNTLFKNASTAKVFTALAILKLEELGKVNLDKPISNYLSKIHPSIAKLTLRRLLSHTAGLKDKVSNFGPKGRSQQIAYAQGLDNQNIFTSPGKVFSYSNTGYNIVGAVIEAVTERDFNSAMKMLVFEPLGMNRSTMRIEEAEQELLAYGHSVSGSSYSVNSSIPDNAFERASGMMLTTAPEYNLFLQWLIKGKNNKLQSKLLNIIADTVQTGMDWSYGFGLFHSQHCHMKAIWHTGGIPGYRALILAIPEKDFSMVVFTNGPRLDRWKLINMATEAFLQADCSLKPPSNNFQAFSNEEMESLLGTYDLGFGNRMRIFKKDKNLYAHMDGQEYVVQKNEQGKLIVLQDGEVQRNYSIFKNQKGEVEFLQSWVRAYSKISD